MYEIFEKLCNEYGITPYKFCKDNDVRTSTISTWKKKGSLIGTGLARKICDYFNVSMDYLMTGKEAEINEKHAMKPIEELDIAKKLKAVIGDINDKETSPLYYNGEKIDDKSLAILEAAIMSVMKQMDIMKDKK